MRIGIIGQPCIDEIIQPGRDRVDRALGGVLYSFAAMERLIREANMGSFVPMSWLSVPDRPILDPLLDTFRYMDRNSGLWPMEAQTNRVQLVYRENGDRTEHCSHILLPLTGSEINSTLLDSLDGLFVNMISGFDIGIETLEVALAESKKRPYVHLDIHALVLGALSERNADAPFGGGRTPRGVKEWKRWLAIADSVQMNELEARWLADPEIQSERELLQYILLSNQFPKLRYLIITRAERGATLFDFEHEMVFNAVASPIKAIETTGSGDVFGSAFIFFVLSGSAPEEALQKAVEWASWNTTLGNIEQILESDLSS
jgi:pfkB family carbohydrate kinase